MRPTSVRLLLILACFCLPLSSSSQNTGPKDKETKSARGEVLVKFREVAPGKIQALAKAHDFDRGQRLGGVARLYRFRSRSKGTEQLVKELSARSDVLYAEPNFVVKAVEQPNDPRFAELWGLNNIGQSFGFGAGTPGADIGALAAWQLSTGNREHLVAVIDTGIDYTHPDLAPNVWSAPEAFTVTVGGVLVNCPAGSHGFNAITGTCDPMDDNRHGTHVSGTIGAAGNNSLGVVGVNWSTQLLGIKFLDANGSGYISDAVTAIEFAIQIRKAFPGRSGDVRVLSNSWGGGGYSQALLDEIKRAGDNDMLFVVAAGNNGYDNDRSAFYPASYAAPNLLAVAATDNKDNLAGFSNFGSQSVQLGAPGVNILSTVLGSGYDYLSGTSMATPHVSGAAALVLSRCALNTAGLKASLTEQVDLLTSLGTTTVSGGRLNVGKALDDCTAPVGVSPGALSFPRQVINTTSAAKTITLINRQQTPLSIGGIASSGDFKESSSCGTQLAAGAKCPIAIRFSPTMLGYATAKLTITDDAGNSPQVVNLSGYGIEAAAVSPAKIDFAGVVLGTSSRAQYVTLTNNQSDRPLAISSIVISGHFSQTNNCGTAVAALQSCTVLVTYTPVAMGAETGTLTISHNAANSPFQVALAGTGVSRVTLSPAAVDFGGVTVGTISTSRSVSLTNNQKNTVLLITSIVATGDFSQTNTCGSQVAAAATCAISLSFRPTAMGVRSGSIVISDNTPESPRAVALSGTGLGLPDLMEKSVSSVGALIVGSSVQVSDTTVNQGTGAATSSTTRYYLSASASSVPSGMLLSGTRTVPALAAGQSSPGTATVTLSPYTVPGNYYLLACADDTRYLIESNESNNCACSGLLQVSGADLVETSITISGALIAGGSVQVTDTVANKGVASAGSSTTRYYLSTVVSSVPAGTLLTGSRAVPALTPGASSTGTATVAVGPYTPTGSYYVLACADGNRYVAENNESNNCVASALVQVRAQ